MCIISQLRFAKLNKYLFTKRQNSRYERCIHHPNSIFIYFKSKHFTPNSRPSSESMYRYKFTDLNPHCQQTSFFISTRKPRSQTSFVISPKMRRQESVFITTGELRRQTSLQPPEELSASNDDGILRLVCFAAGHCHQLVHHRL